LGLQKIDSIKKVVAAKDSLWTKYIQKQKDSLAIERKISTRLYNENKRLKNRPVPNWSAPQLDSIIGTIIR